MEPEQPTTTAAVHRPECHHVGGDGPCYDGCGEPAPFPDGWPTVPAVTVTLDGRVVLAAPLMNDRQTFDVGPYKVWVNR